MTFARKIYVIIPENKTKIKSITSQIEKKLLLKTSNDNPWLLLFTIDCTRAQPKLTSVGEKTLN